MWPDEVASWQAFVSDAESGGRNLQSWPELGNKDRNDTASFIKGQWGYLRQGPSGHQNEIKTPPRACPGSVHLRRASRGVLSREDASASFPAIERMQGHRARGRALSTVAPRPQASPLTGAVRGARKGRHTLNEPFRLFEAALHSLASVWARRSDEELEARREPTLGSPSPQQVRKVSPWLKTQSGIGWASGCM